MNGINRGLSVWEHRKNFFCLVVLGIAIINLHPETLRAADGSWENGTFSGSLGVSHNLSVGDSLRIAGFGSNLSIGAAYATGGDSFAMGPDTYATGWSSMAIGMGEAAGSYSFTMGESSVARGLASAALIRADTWGDYSLAAGMYATTMGKFSSAVGLGTIADAYASIALGSYNSQFLSASTTSWVGTDPLLIVGNGTGTAQSPFLALHNTLVMLKSGKISLYGTSATTPPIVFDPDNSLITINGQSVMTSGTGAFVGIGTGVTTPFTNLHVMGGTIGKPQVLVGSSSSSVPPAIELRDNAATPNRWQLTSGAANGTDGKFTISDARQGQQRVVIDSAGNVGIGTASPINRLTVVAASDFAPVASLESNITDFGSWQSLDFVNTAWGSRTREAVIRVDYPAGTPSFASALSFYTNPGGWITSEPVERLRITYNGNVGIGTTSPQALLQVGPETGAGGNSPAAIISRLSTENGTAMPTTLLFTRRYASSAALGLTTGNVFTMASESGTGGMDFRSSSSYTAAGGLVMNGVSRLRILDNGNVGIGNPTPQVKLDVVGDMNVSGVVKMAKRQGDVGMGRFTTVVADK